MMNEKCEFAYRKNGINAVMCRVVQGNYPYCAHQYMCHNTKRWEADKQAQCLLREKGRRNKEQ